MPSTTRRARLRTHHDNGMPSRNHRILLPPLARTPHTTSEPTLPLHNRDEPLFAIPPTPPLPPPTLCANRDSTHHPLAFTTLKFQHRLRRRALATESRNIARRSSTMPPTTSLPEAPRSTYISSPASSPPKHHTPSSRCAAATLQIASHHGYLTSQ